MKFEFLQSKVKHSLSWMRGLEQEFLPPEVHVSEFLLCKPLVCGHWLLQSQETKTMPKSPGILELMNCLLHSIKPDCRLVPCSQKEKATGEEVVSICCSMRVNGETQAVRIWLFLWVPLTGAVRGSVSL